MSRGTRRGETRLALDYYDRFIRTGATPLITGWEAARLSTEILGFVAPGLVATAQDDGDPSVPLARVAQRVARARVRELRSVERARSGR